MSSLKKVAVTVTLALLSVQAWAQAPRPRPRPTPNPVINPAPAADIRLIEEVNQFYYGQSVLRLRQMFNLGNAYEGYEVKKVELQAQSDWGQARAQLLINNRPTGLIETINNRRSISTFTPEQGTVIGDDVTGLQLRLNGNIQVFRVAITLAPAARSEVIEQRYWQQFQGDNMIQVRQVLNIGAQHNGKALEYVELTAQSFAGRAQALLLINGNPVTAPQIIDQSYSTLRFELPTRGANVLGRDVQSIALRVVGNVRTDALAVGLISQSRPGPRPGPMLPKVQVREPNVVITGTSSINLAQLLADARYAGRRVQSVEIQGRSRNGNGRVSVCEHVGYRNDCRSVQTLGTTVTRTHHFIGAAILEDLAIEAQGQLLISQVVIHFQ
jgi:hypothetical protein